jgi:hypothetical protein
LKSISVSLGYDCIKNPRCSFCYAKDRVVPDGFEPWTWRQARNIAETINKYVTPETTICWEYSGTNLRILLEYDWDPVPFNCPMTMTTMKEAVTPVFCEAMKKFGISAISLSYDKEKVKDTADLTDWCRAADMIREVGMKVGCNFLIEDPIVEIPFSVLSKVEQVNLLTLKPTGKLRPKVLNIVNLIIEQFKSMVTVTTDNCLGVQLGLMKSCRRGIDFIHITSNGEVEECCFKDKCYLYDIKLSEFEF